MACSRIGKGIFKGGREVFKVVSRREGKCRKVSGVTVDEKGIG